MPRRMGLAGGLGARYGRFPRHQYVEIVSGLRSKHECPRCHFRTVKRSSVGIWNCRKCGHRFAGGAYTPTTKLGEIATRATRGLMSPSTLSTELDSLRGGAKVAQSVAPPTKRKPRARRKKVEIADTAEKPALEEERPAEPAAETEPANTEE